MCLGVVGRIIEIDGATAVVDFWGVRKKVRLETLDSPVNPGDHILNHAGFAIRRVPDEMVEETMAFYDEIIRQDDLLAKEVKEDIPR